MPARVLHLSDLHVGSAHEGPDLGPALARLVERVDPELVVASGDLTHRGRRAQHERAAGFLRRLGRPLLVVPGNHDIPHTPLARVRTPFAEFEREWETAEPVVRTADVVAVGVNSVRPWRHQSGRVRDAQIERVAAALAGAPPGALRLVALHHHLIGAPWRSRKRPVARRADVLAGLVGAGAELIVAGHIHQAAVSERRDFEVATGDERGVVVAIAPGLGTPRPHRHGEACGLQVYEARPESLRVETYVWCADAWEPTAERLFARGSGPLAVAQR